MNSWLVPLTPGTPQGVNVVCFPYAGGGASIYRSWANLLPVNIQAYAVQPPGRESRFSEPLIPSLSHYVESVTEAILALSDRQPTILFGHSLGSLVAYETAVSLTNHAYPLRALVVSGRQSPMAASKRKPISHLPDAEFIEQMATFNGTPSEVLANSELVQLLTPMIKKDFSLSEQYTFPQYPPLTCPVYALGARNDVWLDEASLDKWQEVTSAAFQTHWFEGDHFYLNKQAPELVRYLTNIVF